MSRPTANAWADRFETLSALGVGAIGEVHRVRDRELGRDVARKTVLRASPEQIYHLKQEFRVVAGIVHPNLVRLFELFAQDGACFFTMELVEGLHIDEYVRGTPASRRESGMRPTTSALRTAGSPSSGFRPDRFVEAMCQVVTGVAELHAAGHLHRDIKPSNVLVTAEGRAVVLDFGFAIPWGPEDASTDRVADMAGTLPYMAPEQLFRGRAVPASDWYSLGATMYEVVTGELPFTGSANEILVAKTRPLAAKGRAALGPIYGPLVAGLLDPTPEKRPTAKDILAALGGPVDVARRQAGSRAPFVGRRTEIERLQRALDLAIASKTMSVVHVSGVSGIGKSELMRRFIASRPDVRAAAGRSRPQESVPYKIFDGVMDELSQRLVQLPPDRRRGLWPEHTMPLLRLFPVLRRAREDGREPMAESMADPREERRFAFVALRQLVEAIAADAPLVLCFDDVQWGDLDSVALLGSLMNPPLEAPVLVVLGYRSEDMQTSAFLRALEEPAPTVARCTIQLDVLSAAETIALGKELLAGYEGPLDLDATALVGQSGGSPFLVGEMARNIAEAGGSMAPARDVVGARLERLTETERALLETVAAAGTAIRLETVLTAAAREDATRIELLRLSDLRWLRQTTVELDQAVETYHDRLREHVLERLAAAPDRLRDTHRRIASALDKPGADPERLLVHYAAAGEMAVAGGCAMAAAERANAALAFERAAELFLRALELRVATHSPSQLHAMRAEALTNAGRALDAARAFEAAARLTYAGSADERLELLRRAGEHYLRTAHYDEGLAIMDGVLRAVGAGLPRSQRSALLPSAVKRVRFLLRGIEFTPREPDDVPAPARRRLEALWSTGISLALLDHQRADPIALTHLLEALDHGDAAQALRALAYESGVQAGIGGDFLRSRSARIQGLVYERAEERGIPYERAWARLAIGSCAWFGGRWRRCVEYCDQGATIFREQCRGVPWEIATMQMFSMSALAIMGDIDELERRLPHAIRAAEEKGDLFDLNNCRLGQPSILWLARGRATELRALAAKADGSMWKGGYHAHRYHYAFAMGQADLYDGDPYACLARLDAHWPGLKESRIFYLEWPQIELRHLRARAWLLAARLMRDGHAPPPRYRRLRYKKLARAVSREADAIAKHRIPPAAALAATLRAALSALEGQEEERLRAAARDACAAADMTLLADLLARRGPAMPALCQALGIH